MADAAQPSRAQEISHACRGLANGGPRALGYDYDARIENGELRRRLVVNQAEAAVIRCIYAEFIGGNGQRAICRGLDADGIPSQRGYQWQQGTVAHYLANPLYKGDVHLNAEVYEGQHESIVDAATCEKARQLREALARGPGGGRGRHTTGGHLFTKGMLKCGSWREPMIARTAPTRSPGKVAETYICYGLVRHGTHSYDQRPVKRSVIDGAV